MKIPPILIGAALLFWGKETDNLFIGMLLCLLFEGSHVVKTRYDLTEEECIKISDLTSLIFLGSVALILINFEPIGFLRITAGWLPLTLSPLMAAQLYSTRDKIIIGTRLGKAGRAHTHRPVDFRFYYFIITLFAAATANSRSVMFFPFMALLFAWLILHNRGRSYSLQTFVLLFCATLGLGYVCVVGMERTQRLILQKTFRFWHNYYREQMSDPFRSHIHFGDTGRMKLSGEIIMRIDAATQPPRLFREAGYSTYGKGNWFGSSTDYSFLAPLKPAEWNLTEPLPDQGDRLEVEFNLPKEKGLLPYPRGSYHLSSDTIFEMERNRDGTIKVMDGAPVISYEILYSNAATEMATTPGSAKNLILPEDERYAIEEAVQRIKGDKGNDAAKIEAVRQFFAEGFSYSLSLVGKGEYATPLGNFLLQHKSGFCEYYATGTALLLRSLGVPSRYAVGYAVQEKSRFEGKYVVRKRHAHAWAEAYVDNRWIAVDTTPSDWLVQEAENASYFEALQDLVGFIRHKYRLFQIGSGADNTLVFSAIVIVLTTFLALRIYRRMKLERAGRHEGTVSLRSFERITSPFTAVIDALREHDELGETGASFIDTAKKSGLWKDFDADEFGMLYRLHQRMRFDPRGISAEEMVRLKNGSRTYLAALEKVEA